jgi:hypothetical protein
MFISLKQQKETTTFANLVLLAVTPCSNLPPETTKRNYNHFITLTTNDVIMLISMLRNNKKKLQLLDPVPEAIMPTLASGMETTKRNYNHLTLGYRVKWTCPYQ